MKQVKRREPKKSWITNRVKRHIANRDKLYQLWMKIKSNKDYEKYKKKRNEVNMEIKKAKRNEVQTKLDHKNSKELFSYVKKCDSFVEDFNNYFITAIDTSDTILTHPWNSQQAEKPQSRFLRPVTDAVFATYFHIEKQKIC